MDEVRNMTNDMKEVWQIFGISHERYMAIAKEVEHLQVDYRLSDLTEAEYVKKLFPNLKGEDQVKALYYGRVQWHSGHNVGRTDP